MTDVKLKVAEAIQEDVNKGIVRIDNNLMKEMGVRPGDIVEVQGEDNGRKTVAIADRAFPGDFGLNVIRMDGLIRRNAKAAIGDFALVKKANVKEAKKVTIAPAREGIVIRANPIIFKNGLLGRAVVKGDVVSLGGARSRRTSLSSSPFFDDIFNVISEGNFGFGLGELKFVVVDTQPKDSVIIVNDTQVVFKPEAQEVIDKEEELPDISYEDIGGLGDELKQIREMVELPLKHPEVFERLGIEPPKGVLLHGPPGTGKTLLAKAVATETNSNFIVINGPEIMSKYYGQSEENLRKKFEEAEKNAPSIIFIDEIDAIATKREETHGEVEKRVVAQLLAIMDGLKSRGKVVVIAASNIPNSLDPALRRPGRFDREIEIGVPQKEGRLEVLKIHTRNMPLSHRDLHEEVEFFIRRFKDELSHLHHQKETAESDVKIAEKQKKESEQEYKQCKKELDKTKPDPQKEELHEQCNRVKADVLKQTERVNKLTTEIVDIKKKITILTKYESFVNKKSDVLDFVRALQENTDKHEAMRNELKNAGFLNDNYAMEAETQGTKKMLEGIAEVTHGFVGADLAALAKEAAILVLRRLLPEIDLKADERIPEEKLASLRVRKDDFVEALRTVRPSALREVLIEIPEVCWEDVGGLDDINRELIETVEWPIKNKKAFSRLGVKPPKGVLLYGPPGTGKTLLAKAVAHESQANFILVNGPEMLSKWVGESEKGIRKIFQKARQTSPTIIFFDELDAIAPQRGISSDSHVSERVVNQLLTEMDGLQGLQNIVIIAATNRPDIVDTALLRPGRFDRIIYVHPPNKEGRKMIFEVHTKSMPLALSKGQKIDKFLMELAEKTEGYAGADIEAVCREAAIFALRESIDAKDIKMKHFEDALNKVSPSLSKDIEKAYSELKDKFTGARARELRDHKPSYFG